MTVIDAVQVQPEDVVFLVLRFERGRDHRLAQLAQDRLLWGLQDGNFGQLFRDRAGALRRAAGDDIDDAGLDDTAPVDAMVLIEVLVLHRNRRVTEAGTDVLQLDRDHPNALGVSLFDQGAVPVDDLDVPRGQVQPARIGEGGEGVAESAENQQHDQADDDADDCHPVTPNLEPLEAVLPPAGRSCRRGSLTAPTLPSPASRGGECTDLAILGRRRACANRGPALGWSRLPAVYRFFETAACPRSYGVLAPLTSRRA